MREVVLCAFAAAADCQIATVISIAIWRDFERLCEKKIKALGFFVEFLFHKLLLTFMSITDYVDHLEF